MVTTKDMVQVYMLTLHVLATKDDFMSDDREAFNTAVWETLDDTKNQLIFCCMIACAYEPLLWWRNHEPYVPIP